MLSVYLTMIAVDVSQIHSLTVADGLFTAMVPARSAIAIHTGALGTGSSVTRYVAATFQETATTTFGEVKPCVLTEC
jgi:hypothetical protein